MLEINEENVRIWSELGSKATFGKALLAVGESVPDVVVLSADLAASTKVLEFARRFPERFFQIGLAEQNMVGVASGLAMAGKVAFVTTFACFASMRSCEQIRLDAAYPNLNIKIVGTDAGIVMSNLGSTHEGLEDTGIIRSIPNMVVLSPADGAEIVKATEAVAMHQGPVYMRLTGGKGLPIVYRQDFAFEIGRSIKLRDGQHATLVASGTMVARALEAADVLLTQGISARVIDMHTIKPIDVNAIQIAARETDLIVSVEENSIVGGLGSAVSEVLAEYGRAPRLIRMGLPDEFMRIASREALLASFGLTPANIADVVRRGISADGRAQ